MEVVVGRDEAEAAMTICDTRRVTPHALDEWRCPFCDALNNTMAACKCGAILSLTAYRVVP